MAMVGRGGRGGAGRAHGRQLLWRSRIAQTQRRSFVEFLDHCPDKRAADNIRRVGAGLQSSAKGFK
jgi:hypothetical protein